jgi:hypothetical protein
MAKRLQLRGGTTAEHSTFTGALREVTVDTDKDTLVVHDGSTAGGFPLAKYSDVTAISTDLVNDTTPQLGGDLDTNGNDINFGDSDNAQFGASQDLKIFHDGSNSYVKDTGTGDLIVQGVNVRIQGATTGNNMFVGVDNGASTLYYQNNTKLTTTSSGIDVTGTLLADKGYIAETTLTDGATISWNMSTQSVAKVTLGGNRTIAAPTNGSTGQFASLLVAQDGTGGRTLTWNAVYEFASDTAPTLTATASLGDLFVFRYNGSKWLEVGRNLALTLS